MGEAIANIVEIVADLHGCEHSLQPEPVGAGTPGSQLLVDRGTVAHRIGVSGHIKVCFESVNSSAKVLDSVRRFDLDLWP